MPAGRKFQPLLFVEQVGAGALTLTPELLPRLVMVIVPVTEVQPWGDNVTCGTSMSPVTLPVELGIGVKLITVVALHLAVATMGGVLVPLLPVSPLRVRLIVWGVDVNVDVKRVKLLPPS